MRTLMVCYDLNRPGRNYEDLWTAIKNLGTAWWHHLDSTWIVLGVDLAPLDVVRRLKQYIDSNDELFVVDIKGVPAAWIGFDEKGRSWLKENL